MTNRRILFILLAILSGFTVGFFTKEIEVFPFFHIYDLFGQLFINSLTLMVIPLVTSAIISGISKIEKNASVTSLGRWTGFYYLLTLSLASLLGFVVMSFVPPLEAGTFSGSLHTSIQKPPTLSEFIPSILLKIVPNNLVFAASSGNMLGIIFFSILLGWAISHQKNDTLRSFFESLFGAMMHITQKIISFLPIGIFFLVARSVHQSGFEQFRLVFFFGLTVLSGLSLFLFLVIPSILYLHGISIRSFFRSVYPALITAFSTSSSIATLPVTIRCIEKEAGVPPEIARFVLPIGTSLNMTGSALYECISILFIAHVFQIDLHFGELCSVFLLSLLASIGTAGIPSGSLISVMIILNTLGFPPEAISLIIPLERFLDMFRTMINVASESACAILVARSQGAVTLSKR